MTWIETNYISVICRKIQGRKFILLILTRKMLLASGHLNNYLSIIKCSKQKNTSVFK